MYDQGYDTDSENQFAERTAAARASMAAKARAQEARGYAVMAGFMSYGEAAMGEGLFGRFARGAKWFCLWFAMIAPILMVIHLRFGG